MIMVKYNNVERRSGEGLRYQYPICCEQKNLHTDGGMRQLLIKKDNGTSTNQNENENENEWSAKD
jgi:hypothetical protein